MTDTPEVKTAENDARITVDAACTVASIEITGHLHKLLAWLKTEFTNLGLDIEAEIKKL